MLARRKFTHALLAIGLSSLLLGAASVAHADVVMPLAWYDKPDQPLLLGFYSGPTKPVHLADDPSQLQDGYSPAKDALDDKGMPAFTLYTFDGQKIEPKNPTPGADPAKINLDNIYPDIRSGGTYILVWKDAEPLVIENLYNPGQGAKEFAKFKNEIGGLPDSQRKDILQRYSPTVLHIVPLQYAVIKTDKGDIKATFAYDVAPHTVDNFVSLARQKFYDGTVFHRIIKGFMIQGGDSTGNVEGRAGTGGPGYEITAEFSDKQHDRGVLSMARSQDPNSAGSQFFIMHAKNSNLDGQYTAFGQVIDGMPVVDQIAKTPVSDDNGTVKGPKPVIESITILPATPDMYGIKK
ncbi:MAG TPA: peptidylprolyl isomerase [Phycisphaerae bacterium]|nr:peptidylprolyl isomerase [Phycisphaerae bacterium]